MTHRATSRCPIMSEHENKITGEPLFDPDNDEIVKGTAICHVRNTLLTAGLIAMGVPLRNDPAMEHVKMANGKEVFTYNFFPSTVDGRYSTSDLIQKWKRSVEFIADEERRELADPSYQIHPWARVITGLQNYRDLLEGQAINVPFIPFGYMSQQGPVQLMYREGTAKHKHAIKKGLKPL